MVRCSICGGALVEDPEGERVCGSCGSVAVKEEVPMEMNPYERSPLNHGVAGKNLGTCQRELYRELAQVGVVSGSVAGWDLDSIEEKDSVMRREVMWFTNLALKRGFTDVNVDPLARVFRAAVKTIQEEETKEMERRVKVRVSGLRRLYADQIERFLISRGKR